MVTLAKPSNYLGRFYDRLLQTQHDLVLSPATLVRINDLLLSEYLHEANGEVLA